MRWLIPIAFFFIASTAAAETINLTCYSDSGGKKFAFNITIVAPTARAKGKVFVDDRDLDSVDPGSRQEVTKVRITPSSIYYEVHFKTSPEYVNGKQYGQGTVDIFKTISRTSGLFSQRTITYGGLLGEAVGEGSKYSEGQCEPRRANKF
jgi:hypothetical protein